ncbi:hypothetical protein [Frankia gtarii]|uniref:hypothetical protein n=1 Tax=Frankia gtarii TaxID=2950102 RepID=UPI0021C14D4A|nr:hypothetical protein [Frankia gtarii]
MGPDRMVPAAAPLRHDQVRHLADCAGQVIMPAMLGEQPEPLAAPRGRRTSRCYGSPSC